MSQGTDRNSGFDYQEVRNILLVEDDPDTAAMIQWIFSRIGSKEETLQRFALQVISDGKKAVCNIREVSFDLILLDISLPVMSGFEVLIEARKYAVYTPIFMFSSSKDVEDVHYAYYLGANGFIHKSGGIKNIEARLVAVCECYFIHLEMPCPLS